MYKRLLSLLICLLILASLPLSVFADEPEGEVRTLSISNVKEFLAFAESCRLDSYSHNLSVTLEKDLDLSGRDFQGIPIFSGSFDGKGHSIKGLSITVESSAVGFFRYLEEGASVSALTLIGDVLPSGSRSSVGGFAGVNRGTVENCTFLGTVTGNDYIGGIVGINELNGIIQGCSVEGSVSGKHFAGGIAGNSKGVIRGCQNYALINTESQENVVDIDDISVESLISTEAANTVTDVGGIAGSNSGVIRDCKNHAAVGYKHMGYNIGGIAGTQMGYITNCENYGHISGRKEVGGIAGQMEPVSLIEYNIDTLQILQGQLETMQNLTDRASANAQGGMAGVSGELGALGGYTSDAMEAIGTLIPSEDQEGEAVPDIPDMPDIPELDNMYMPDEDTVTAAQNNLSASMSGMQSSMNRLMSGMQGTVNTLSNDMRAITNQVSLMSETIENVGDTMGGSITDVSDLDEEDILTGKVEGCCNFGDILADANAGGISGAMAISNDLDHEADVSFSGENSLNFESKLRAVVLRCQNTGAISAGKQNGGGIAGLMDIGLAKLCTNTGSVENSAGDYMGGIAGQSRGYIRSCYAKCIVSGDDYTGGIAGSGTVVTDCRSMTLLTGRERYGNTLGWANDDTDEEEPLRGNFYAVLDRDSGAVDRISYDGKARALPLEDFLSLKGLPELFSCMKVEFIFEDGSSEVLELIPGQMLSESMLPSIPAKAGYLGHWEGLSLTEIPFDSTVTLVYTPLASTVESAQLRTNGRPILIASGTLALGAEVVVEEAVASNELIGNRTLLDTLSFTVTGAESERISLRYLPPMGISLKHLSLKVCDSDGTWLDTEYRIDGSYIVFEADSDVSGLSIERNNDVLIIYACIGAAGISLLLLVIIIARRAGKKKAAAKAAE